MRKVAVILCILLLSELYGQHMPVYSGYFFNPVTLNPADAGFRKALDVSVTHRRQWVSFEGAPTTTTFVAHTALTKEKLNIGLSCNSDRYGVTSKLDVKALFAYRVFLQKDKHLSFGIAGGWNQYSNRWSEINSSVGGDPVFIGGDDRRSCVTIGAGIMYRSPRLAIGLAIPELLQTNRGAQRFQYLVSAEYKWKVSQDITIVPMVAARHLIAAPAQPEFACTMQFREQFSLGLGYRSQDAVTLVSKFRINQQLEVGYAYDATVSKLRGTTGGSHEILIRYLFLYPTETRRPRT